MSWSKSFCVGHKLKIDDFNPDIANTFFRAGSIEAWGRGIERIRDDCKTHGSPDPQLRYEATGLTIEFPFAAAYVESVPESQPESQPESLEIRVLRLLRAGPLAKSELSEGLGQKEVSGQLNKVVRALLEGGAIEYTIPNKPRSRLQKYRLTTRGEDALADNSVGGELQ